MAEIYVSAAWRFTLLLLKREIEFFTLVKEDGPAGDREMGFAQHFEYTRVE